MYTVEIFQNLVAAPEKRRATDINDGKGGRVEALYRNLKSDLLCAKFTPGERLIEERLTERYGLPSRTPVREVLARLKSEGHVGVRGRSFISPEYAASSLLHLYDVRQSLEVLAIKGATEKGDLSVLRNRLDLIAQAQERGDPAAVNAADGLFHLTIAEMSGNSFLIDILSQIHEKVFQIRNLFFATETEQQDLVAEHRLLLVAIERGVTEIAEAEMSHHLIASRQKFKESMN